MLYHSSAACPMFFFVSILSSKVKLSAVVPHEWPLPRGYEYYLAGAVSVLFSW
jgi:hypothetical protein